MSKGNAMHVLLTENAGEITGTIQTTGDGLFMLECLALIVESLAKKVGTTPVDVARDLHSLVAGKVTR